MLPATKMGHVIYEIVQKQPFFTAGIERLVKAFRQDLKVCLLCSEGRPTDCHRSKLIGVALDALEIPVVHLCPDGERFTQSEVIASLESLQGDLFGQRLRSRKAYGTKTMTAGQRLPSWADRRCLNGCSRLESTESQKWSFSTNSAALALISSAISGKAVESEGLGTLLPAAPGFRQD